MAMTRVRLVESIPQVRSAHPSVLCDALQIPIAVYRSKIKWCYIKFRLDLYRLAIAQIQLISFKIVFSKFESLSENIPLLIDFDSAETTGDRGSKVAVTLSICGNLALKYVTSIASITRHDIGIDINAV
jgi:hypothetical protein